MIKLVMEQKEVEEGVKRRERGEGEKEKGEEGVLKGAIFETKSGRGLIRAKVLIDASGDADLAFQAGVPMVIGRESDQANQPMALRFNLGQVNLLKARDYFASLGEFDWTDNPHDPELPLWSTACT